MWYHYARMSSLKFAAIVGAGAVIGAFLAFAVVIPQAVSAAAGASKLILTQWLGLGTSTPSQRLSVAGSAYITGDVITGSSIKFPDGTTQTTAAAGGSSGISGYERVSQTTTYGYGFQSGGWSVSCSSGKKVLGGGCYPGPNGACIGPEGQRASPAGYPSSETTYTCGCPGYPEFYAYQGVAYAICATVQ